MGKTKNSLGVYISVIYLILSSLSAFSVLMSLSALPVSGLNISEFKYGRPVSVNCSDFMGYGIIEADNEILAKSHDLDNVYMDAEYYILQGVRKPSSGWYTSWSNVQGIDRLKVLFDSKVATYFPIESPYDQLDLIIKNPDIQTFNEITIKTVDSEIYKTRMFYSGELFPKESREGFTYSYRLDDPINGNELNISIFFKNILKLAEIQIYNRETKSTINFFINNECDKTYNLFYGESGGRVDYYKKAGMGLTTPAILHNEKVNPVYIADFDNDGVENEKDNCLNVPNTDQADLNGNGVGDGCEDFDKDGVLNSKDNCLNKYNPDQIDVDVDGRGDACDSEDDRASEKFAWVVYAVAIVAVIIFVIVGIKIIKKK